MTTGLPRTVAHKVAYGRLRLARRAMDGLDQPPARDGEAEAVAEQRRNLAVGQPVALIEEDREGDRLRAELHGRGAERIGRLQRMPPLDPAAAAGAPPNVNVEATDERPLHGQLFLILRREALAAGWPPRSADSWRGSGTGWISSTCGGTRRCARRP